MVKIDLKKKVAIVVGAGRGLGEAIALKLAEAGADVVVADLLKENAEEVAKKIAEKGGVAKGFKIDVTNQKEIDDLVDGIVNEYGKIDIMVNNAGYNIIKLFEDSDISEFDKMIDINLRGVYYGCKAAVIW